MSITICRKSLIDFMQTVRMEIILLNWYEIITSKQNIRLAYRNIKTNSGSTTAGVDGKTIKDIKKMFGAVC